MICAVLNGCMYHLLPCLVFNILMENMSIKILFYFALICLSQQSFFEEKKRLNTSIILLGRIKIYRFKYE